MYSPGPCGSGDHVEGMSIMMLRTLVALQSVRTRLPRTRGVTMLEYVLLALLVVIIGAALWALFGNQLRGAFQDLGRAIRDSRPA